MIDPGLDLSLSPIPIPARFHGVVYDYDRFPGEPQTNGLEGGANCQQYVYELLRHYGFFIPDLRSSELWEDRRHTIISEPIQCFDLVLLHKEPSAWGAHVGLCLGGDLILHLSKGIGLPAIEMLAEMMQRDEYGYFIGAKKVLARSR